MNDSYITALEDSMEPIWEIAHGFGLDPYPVHFEMVPPSIMYEFGSYGLPGRFSHWSHGKVYHRMKTSYDYGLSKIYELVINTNPSYAFLMDANSLLQNKLVIAHVLGHCDFFKHNAYFQSTNRRMVETASLNANRIRQYEYEHGLQKVERFMDAVLSIQEHIDPQDARRSRSTNKPGEEQKQAQSEGSPFDDLFDLTPGDKSAHPERKPEERVPARPEKDLVGFIMEHARHLEPWQRDVIGIVRQEMLYFVPQMQTKICNEGWACATGDSLLLTEDGFVRFDYLHEQRQQSHVAAGGAGDLRPITGHHREVNVPTLRLRTRRGLTIEGAHKHRLLMADGTWKYLADVRAGDRIAMESGMDIWPEHEQCIDFVQLETSLTLETVATYAGVSTWTVARHIKGQATRSAVAIDAALHTMAYRPGCVGKLLNTRSAFRSPATLNADVAWLLGCFVGDGNRTKSGIGFTTGDYEIAAKLVDLVARLFGLRSSMRWDPASANGRWRILVHSRELARWLTHVGINLYHKAHDKCIPSLVLRSPRKVMSAFLKGYFDADAYAGAGGVILSSSSATLTSTVQVVLLNYGILSSQRPQKDGSIQLHIYGASAKRFRDEIDFGLSRKRDALDQYVEKRRCYKREELSDAVISIEYGHGDVFDITVADKHTYVANGFLNHNSFWHSRIMRDMELTDEEYTDFAAMNAGVLAPSRSSINPYYLGVKILEDIERRWDNPTEEERRKWGRSGGEGRKKLFEVRAEENDVSLIRNYMTEQLVDDLDLYLYEKQGDQWVIVDKKWENVRDNIVARMANFGNPTILVEDGDYQHNGELYLRHTYDGHELDALYAEKTLEHVYALWGRPVHLETLVEGEATVFIYDGGKHNREPV